LYLFGPAAVYCTVVGMLLVAFVLVCLIEPLRPQSATQASTTASLLDGLRYVLGHRALSGAISLDLFGVLFGGATLETPDGIRGRVGAVGSMFIGASNELGEFESGVTARWFGLVPAVVLGGVLTLLVLGSYLRLFPELRTMDRFKRKAPAVA